MPAAETAKFHADVHRLTEALFATEPYKSHRSDFNVRAIDLPAAASGVTDPRTATWRRSPLGLAYNAFDSERYMLTFADEAVREAAAQAPYDALILLSNSRKYGGGGIFNLWNTAAVDSAESAYLLVHEFGHSFAGLGDEYYTSQVSYENVQPRRQRALGAERHGAPRPAALQVAGPGRRRHAGPHAVEPGGLRQARAQLRGETARAAGEERARGGDGGALPGGPREDDAHAPAPRSTSAQVGAFQGASYQAKGLYRPEVDCIMFSRNPKSFCAVCARAIERMIRMYAE